MVKAAVDRNEVDGDARTELIIAARYISNQTHYRLVRPFSPVITSPFKLYFDVDVTVQYALALHTGLQADRRRR